MISNKEPIQSTLRQTVKFFTGLKPIGQTKTKDRVKFYVEPPLIIEGKDVTGETILAVFPDIKEPKECVLSYAHIGQHGACSLEYLKKCKKAKPYQYRPLMAELQSIGYNLLVV